LRHDDVAADIIDRKMKEKKTPEEERKLILVTVLKIREHQQKDIRHN